MSSRITAATTAHRAALRAAVCAAAACGWLCAPAGAQTMASNATALMQSAAPTPWQGPASEARQGALRMGLNQRTQIVYEPRPWQPATPLPTDYAVRRPQPSLGLEFKTASRNEAARSLLRVQLSGDSVLQFKPRGGGMTVTYKSQF